MDFFEQFAILQFVILCTFPISRARICYRAQAKLNQSHLLHIPHILRSVCGDTFTRPSPLFIRFHFEAVGE